MLTGDLILKSEANVFQVAFAADGTLAGVCADAKVRFWNTQSGALTRTIPWNKDDRRSVTLSAGAKFLIAAGADRVVKFYDLKDGELRHRLAGHTQNTGRAAVSNDGKLAATASGTEVWLWDLPGSKRKSVLADGIGGANELEFSPNGQFLLSANADTDVRVWDTRTGKQLAKIEELPVSMFAVTFSPDSQWLAMAGADSQINLYDTRTWKRLKVLTATPEMVQGLTFSPDGKYLLSGGFDHITVRNPVKVMVWDVATAKPVRTVTAAHVVGSVAFSPDSRLFAAADGEARVNIWAVR